MSLVLITGTFDVFHVGHLEVLMYARRLGDHLTVGIDSDNRVRMKKGYNRPIQKWAERALFVSYFCDDIFKFETDEELDVIVKGLSPTIRVVGSDHVDVLSLNGAELKVFPRTKISSTSLIERIRKS